MDIKDEIKEGQNDTHVHLYEVAIDQTYKDNPQLAEVAKTMILFKLEAIAQIASLEKLLVDKKIITQEEAESATKQENINEIISKLQNSFDKDLLSSTSVKKG
jgi:hypothetical protein